MPNNSAQFSLGLCHVRNDMHQHAKAAELLEELDLGVSIAEIDTLLETARVETSAFADLLNDKVDLVPYGLMIQRHDWYLICCNLRKNCGGWKL